MVEINGEGLSLQDFRAVVLHRADVRLSADARSRVQRSREAVEGALASDRAIYGVTTGFGDLATVRIPPDRLLDLQRRLLLSHAAGVGAPLPDAIVRGMLLLRANALARGYSGVRVEVIERLLDHLRHDLLPVVPERGSVGASGDLAPLAHLALPLIGEGLVRRGSEVLSSAAALELEGWAALELQPKEGLALINGTQAMTASLALSVLRVRHLVRAADLIGALSTDGLRGTDTAFDARIHALRPHPGQQTSAANLWRLLRGSEIRESHRNGDLRVQDPYSIRCMPQVHGAVRDALAEAERALVIEMNAATDNPLVFNEETILSGGNFHGEPLALSADFLAIACAELGSISERRTDKLTNQDFSGLPAFLVQDAGVNSGFMLAQVAAAALVSENKGLAHPASVDSIPTSADKEDHVSMGMTAALKLARVLDNVEQILAIELLAAAQAIDLLRPLHSSEPLEVLHAHVRATIPAWTEDRWMSPDLQAAARLLREDLKDHVDPLD
jgi:histidine ammonia-lyase